MPININMGKYCICGGSVHEDGYVHIGWVGTRECRMCMFMSLPCTRESMHIPISVIIWFLYNLEYITILVTKHMIVQHG
jgi:hypothetical protein